MHVVHIVHIWQVGGGLMFKQNLQLRQWLVDAGCPLDPLVRWSQSREDEFDVNVRVESYYRNKIFQLFDIGGTGYLLDVMITNRSSYPQAILDLFPKLPWDVSDFTWLEDPRELVPSTSAYVFPGKLSFPRGQAINHRICEGGHVPARGFLRGLLLGWSTHSIPKEYEQGANIELQLEILDQGQNVHAFDLSAWVDRVPIAMLRTNRPRASVFAEEAASVASVNSAANTPRSQPLSEINCPAHEMMEPTNRVETRVFTARDS